MFKAFVEIYVPHLFVVGITYTDMDFGFKAISFIVCTGYAAWKWRVDYRRHKNNKG